MYFVQLRLHWLVCAGSGAPSACFDRSAACRGSRAGLQSDKSAAIARRYTCVAEDQALCARACVCAEGRREGRAGGPQWQRPAHRLCIESCGVLRCNTRHLDACCRPSPTVRSGAVSVRRERSARLVRPAYAS